MNQSCTVLHRGAFVATGAPAIRLMQLMLRISVCDWKSACRWFDSAPGHHLSRCHSRLFSARFARQEAQGWSILSIDSWGDNQGPGHCATELCNGKVPQGMSSSYQGDLIRPLGLREIQMSKFCCAGCLAVIELASEKCPHCGKAVPKKFTVRPVYRPPSRKTEAGKVCDGNWRISVARHWQIESQ